MKPWLWADDKLADESLAAGPPTDGHRFRIGLVSLSHTHTYLYTTPNM